jgi:hypothetical protein
MKILNIRLGLATNSSSTHSLIFLPRGASASPVDPAGGPGSYGWDCFQLTDAGSKIDYLSTTLHHQLECEVGRDIADAVVRDWCGRSPDPHGDIDHQSRITLPRGWDGRGIDREFFEDFKAFLLRPDVVVAGGNDNDDGEPDALNSGGLAILPEMPVEGYSMTHGSPWVARKDPSGYWTIFNRDSGAKIRMSLQGSDPGSLRAPPARSSAPELVDVKITDYCPFGCGYCYQDSTTGGKHASREWISSLAWRLGEMRVFEVALGGGEPTLHPSFDDILWSFRMAGVVPNFTTKNLAWLRDAKKRERILGAAGAFAYSAETATEVRDLVAALEGAGVRVADGCNIQGDRRATIQHVVGVADREDQFRDVLLACAEARIPITLLGYKQVGRGPAFGARPSDRWLEIVARVCEDHYLMVGIDTALADRHWDALLAAGVPPHCLTRVEGQFSCYVDAVARTIDTSSYADRPGTPIPDGADLGMLYRDLPR